MLGDLPHTNNLNLDIHLDQFLGQRVNLDETRVDRAVEATEFGDQTDVSLTDWLVRIGAYDTAWDGSTETNTRTQIIDYHISALVSWCYRSKTNVLIDPYQP